MFHKEQYHHSAKDTKYQGIDIGEKHGQEEAYMEISKIFGIPYEEIKEKTFL